MSSLFLRRLRGAESAMGTSKSKEEDVTFELFKVGLELPKR
ncbi:hypothetical protein [Paenibacillus polymyxa]|nr:hypothetical protein [Paenibacillus polymyxa]